MLGIVASVCSIFNVKRKMDYEKMLFYTHSTSKMSQTNCLAPPPLPKQQTTAPLTLTAFKLEPQEEQLQAVKTNTNSNTFLSTTTTATSADPYATYADNFDLSLLPQDCCESPTANIPTLVFQYTGGDNTKTTATTLLTPTSPPQIKIEQNWSCLSKEIKQEPNNSLLYEHQLSVNQLQLPPLQQQQTKTQNLLIPPPPYPHIYPSPQSSPAQSEYNTFPNAQFAGCYDSLSSSRSSLYPSSPCPSIDASNIKQELHILPPSPPESNCETPSPHSSWADIKSEPIDADVETLVDLKTLFEEQAYNDFSPTVKIQPPKSPAVSSSRQQQDHKLLRGYLEDTTFQLKHHLKPLALASIIDSLQEVRGDIEPVISLCLEHAKRDAEETCIKLQISHDPNAWSAEQVHAWLRSTIEQFKLPQIIELEMKFNEDGAALILLSEEEFTRRAPESGSTLHAQLEIWKLAFSDGYQGIQNSTFQQQINEGNLNGVMQQPMQQQQQPQDMWSTPADINMKDDTEDEENAMPSTSAAAAAATIIPSNVAALTTATTSSNATIVASAVPATTAVMPEVKRPGNGRNGGSHIHLWQFLKELLAVPHINGTAIRWIDRSKGIFKIEDSVRVAKLWGKRKNRPAMNYDKLSRSIRQYYKKGIMKKTERSQRLVYQFCHPYHM